MRRARIAVLLFFSIAGSVGGCTQSSRTTAICDHCYCTSAPFLRPRSATRPLACAAVGYDGVCCLMIGS